MNILAHLTLGWPDKGLIIGNFLADQVRGGRFDGLPEDVIRGVKMHRQIDAFTDAHPATKRSAARLRAHIGRYAPVAIDVVYDHFLARDFKKHIQAFSPPLSIHGLSWLIGEAQGILAEASHLFAPSTKGLFDAMVKYEWLFNYQYWEGIERALLGMSRRTKFPSRLEEAASFLFQDLNAYELDYEEIWSALLIEFRGNS